MKRVMKLAAAAAVAFLPSVAVEAGQSSEKLSPFTEVVTEGDTAQVRYEGKRYELLELDGLKTKEILDFARKRYGGRWVKRFAEDLVEVLAGMGRKPGATVKLVLLDPETRERRTVDRAPMTEENRRKVWQARLKGEEALPRPAEAPLGPQEMGLALDAFRGALESRWSYLGPSRLDAGEATEALRKRLGEGMSRDDFALELQKIIGRGIDGHAGVSGVRTSGAGLPFLVEPAGDRFAAFLPDRSKFVEEDFPFVQKIDGLSLDEWIRKAGAFVPDGSAQYVRQQGLRRLRSLAFLRRQSGLAASDSVSVELVSADGARRKKVALALAPAPPAYGVWPRAGSRELEGSFGYLRLPEMTPRAGEEVHAGMAKFRGTKGLVVDVRDNGGGSRDALLALHGYLLPPGAAPRVVNAAVYRLHPEHRADHLEERMMRREDWAGWTPAQREAIAAFRKTFKPSWTPPAKDFSDWHYLVLDRLEDPRVFFYGRPVVVLMNSKCFSATDIFLAGLKGLPNVTLLGEPSGGGSARAVRVRLAPTDLELRIGTMVSFQSDGRLFDGQGIAPDERVDPTPEYFIGGRDAQLEAALRRLRARGEKGR